jgi:hypothetical protein
MHATLGLVGIGFKNSEVRHIYVDLMQDANDLGISLRRYSDKRLSTTYSPKRRQAKSTLNIASAFPNMPNIEFRSLVSGFTPMNPSATSRATF